MQLRNFMEEVVSDYVNRWLPECDICQCESCRMDVMAIMLNKLPPHYVVTDTGALFAQLKDFDLQHKADIMVAMTSAVEIIKQNPRHRP